MIIVLAARGGGGGELAHVLRLLGCRVEKSPSREVDEALLGAADGVREWSDPDGLADTIANPPSELVDRARRALPRSPLVVFHDPRLCLTLPVWHSVADSPAYVVLHRHPFAAADTLRREEGVPLSAGLAMWQLSMLSALHHSRGAARLLVRHDDLRRDPLGVARALHEFLGARGTTLASLDEIGTTARDEPERTSDAQLTRAQLDLHEAFRERRWPLVDDDDPFGLLAKDPLLLMRRANEAARPDHGSGVASELAAELGRARAAARHLEVRARQSAGRLEHAEAERARAQRALDDLRDVLAREREQRAALERQLASLVGGQEQVPAVIASPEERLRLSSSALRVFAKTLYREWTSTEGVPYGGLRDAPPLRVMVGTLHSDENEFEQCVESVRKQRYSRMKHEIFSGLGKKESVATLMTAFQRSDCDLLIKVDADMVLTSPDFVERIVRVFQANPGIDLLSVAILDFFSGGPIQGINAYRKTVEWSNERQDSLFTDHTQVPSRKRLVVWPTFLRDAVHAPNPSPFQAFHFGVHRGLKTLQLSSARYHAARAEEQLAYLEKTWDHFQLRRELRLGLACLGFELALTGCYSLEQLDYTNPSLRESFAPIDQLDVDRVEAAVVELRSRRLQFEHVQRVRDKRRELVAQHQAPVQAIVALLPHTKVFGGVNRFFELARQFAKLGVRFVIAQPENRETQVAGTRSDYPDVEVKLYSEVIDQEWDVVLCGDAFGGVMLTMPLFRAKVMAVYLLNGWGRSPLNHAQIAAVNPDVIIANSSYSAAQYVGYAPTVVPGGVDLETFRPPPQRRPRGPRLKIGAYPGRRKPSKRFEDTLEACESLHARGVPLELHAFDQGPLHLDVKFPVVFHGALQKERVREFFWDMDVMVCAEEDGGWSNPAAEAMASGTPLVCTDAGTIDYAIHEETAIVVPRRDPAAIVAGIERLYRDPELAERLRIAGLARIRGFGWPQVARDLLDALQDARPDPEGRAVKNALALERLAALGVR
ncbi:glycosyltransferase [Sandaracinus amylolyticus]|uniref:Glycosyl transferase, group 1 n=1 Tax=Sandaracinus amylolyticus TaxID=927083 RepID=A0A0F6YLV9_9BACT|nr:glycosyltransferase [Sandaracinus amylolyticus]AKF09666.1 glycosyl transferase, group 1 [Sandaracinus amylolyticus]